MLNELALDERLLENMSGTTSLLNKHLRSISAIGLNISMTVKALFHPSFCCPLLYFYVAF